MIVNPLNLKEQYKFTRNKSPSFAQARRFRSDQLARDNRDQGQPYSHQSQLFSSNYHSYSGINPNLGMSNQEGCRLTNNYCAHDYQCCSGKCRCVRWSIMGKMSCHKKCF
ncbi:unnamed protein product [Adineta steineri]|nr:unnamed protein product [Adineta steineri]CAF0849760.1 unnamed protein product [Adineta steineri]CAF0882121.1 unnamed protein product [Adineta steineri]CAF0895965.1 unnamed protein product [Adineta steineri]CAF3565737.1 unnamed protein product [Adineta steineri]